MFGITSMIILQADGLNLTKILQEILSKFGGALPGIIGAIIVFILGWIISSIIAKGIKTLLSKIGIDKFADNLNQVDLFSKMSIELKPSAILSKIAYYILLLITLMIAAEISGLQELSDLVVKIIEYTPRVLSAFILALIGLVIADFIRKMIVTACDSVGIPSGRIIASFIFYFIFITIIITALEQIGFDADLISNNVTIIIAGIVVAFAIGYGLASRDIMESMLSSFFYVKGKIKVGDRLKVGNSLGEVVAMDSTSITLLTTEQNRIIIPLSRFAEGEIEVIQ